MNSKIAVYLYNLSHVLRFNGFGHPSNKRQDYVTHGFNSLSISTVIGNKAKTNQYIDLENVYGKIIFGSLHPIFFGDIPKAIQKNYPELGEAFRKAKSLHGESLSLEFSETYREIFKSYLIKTDDNSIENEIAKQSENFSVLMKCEEELRAISNYHLKKMKNLIKESVVKGVEISIPREIVEVFEEEQFDEINFHSFLQVYFDTIESIRNSHVEEVQWFFKEVYFSPYIKLVSNMQEVYRWNNLNGDEDHDGRHSFYVAMWSFLLGLIERHQYGKQVSIEKMVGKAVYHDMHEAITSDIISMIKRINPSVKGIIDNVEDKTNYLILSIIPSELQDTFEDFICNPKSDDIEGELLHISDKIEAAIKALREVKSNNGVYQQGYDDSIRAISSKAYMYNSVKDFFTYMLHEFYMEP